MPKPMTSAQARSVATRVGVVTAAIGGALVAAPGPVGSLISLTDPRHARVLGALDLALVPGLLVGRPQWPWLSARAIYNLLIAVYCLRLAARTGRTGRARAFAAFLAYATISDSRAVAGMLRNR